MKSLINKTIHKLMRLAHTPAPCSGEQRKAYLNRAQEVNSEIKEWLGGDGFEMVGLGQNCNASWYIKASGNKQSSYPFDWIFTTPEIILDMLNDDFRSFTNKELLIPHGLDAGHERYHETMFGHRNPATKSADRDYFQRCIERWKSLMQSQSPVLFFSIILNESDKRKRWKAGFTKQFEMPTEQRLSDFDEMIRTFSSINPNCKFLFVEQLTERDFNLSVEEKTKNSLWLNFSAIDKNSGVQYIHEVDDSVMKAILTGLSNHSSTV